MMPNKYARLWKYLQDSRSFGENKDCFVNQTHSWSHQWTHVRHGDDHIDVSHPTFPLPIPAHNPPSPTENDIDRCLEATCHLAGQRRPGIDSRGVSVRRKSVLGR